MFALAQGGFTHTEALLICIAIVAMAIIMLVGPTRPWGK